ncbi:flagellar biosynthetic protein FliO [Thiovibrio sp. JS02]
MTNQHLTKQTALAGSQRTLLAALAAALLRDLADPLLLLAEQTAAGASSPLLLAGNAETLSLTATIFKTIGALILVIGLMLLLLAWIKKMGLAQNSPQQGRLIKLLDMQILAPRKQVAVLEVAGQFLVVGISDRQINLLARLPDNEILRAAVKGGLKPAGLPPSFAALLRKARGASGSKENQENSSDAR